MSLEAKNVAVLGSTGSIGRSTLDVIAASDGRLRAAALSANRNVELLVEQAKRHRPDWVIATDAEAAEQIDISALPEGSNLVVGSEGLEEVVRQKAIDVVLTGIVGSAGLMSTWAAVEAGKIVALANKETLVMAGEPVMQRARETGSTILPVDSEHSAVLQALQAGRREELRRIVLTASGGPFRNLSQAELQQVSVEQALDHPTWEMGEKITIDSATMMNKALEVVEARWLFDLAEDQIEVLVHPQSIVHSMVEFIDGSMIAQLSPPDMRLPIQYALEYPRRRPGVSPRLCLEDAMTLEFAPPDFERFPALELGFQVARDGGTAGAVLNAANERAVAGFLAGEVRFTEIVEVCRSVLQAHPFESRPDLARLVQLDRWAREEVSRWVCA